MSLYTVTSELAELLTLIEEGEIPEEAIADTLESVNLAWEERAEAVISAIKNLCAESEAIKAEEDKLAERRKKKEKGIKRLKEYLAVSMQSVGRTSYESSKHLVSFRKSTAIRITNEAELISWARENTPDVLTTPDPKISLTKIKDIRKNIDVPYVVLDTNINIQIK